MLLLPTDDYEDGDGDDSELNQKKKFQLKVDVAIGIFVRIESM